MQLELNLDDKVPDDLDYLKKEIEDIRQRSENVRKGIFKRHNELCKMFMILQEELNSIKESLNKMGANTLEWDYESDDKLFDLKEVSA